jgi:hypothetical protein
MKTLFKNNIYLLLTIFAVVSISSLAFYGYSKLHKEEGVVPYFIAIHLEPHDIDVSLLEEMVDYANSYNIKLTLMFTAQWVEALQKEDKLYLIDEWEEAGHEISSHHHGLYHSGWDGYTDFSKDEIKFVRNAVNSERAPYEKHLGSLDDFTDILKTINPEIKSGCPNEEVNKATMPDDIIYSTCSGYSNYGESIEEKKDYNLEKGINEYVLVGEVNGIERYWLSHGIIPYEDFAKFDEDKIEESTKEFQDNFLLMNTGVFGAVIHAQEKHEQVTYFKNFLDFVHENDPKGEKSMTLTEVIESDILPHRDLELNDLASEDECDLNGDGFIDRKEEELCESISQHNNCDLNNDGVVDKKEEELCEADQSSSNNINYEPLDDSEVPYYLYSLHIDPVGAEENADLSNRYLTIKMRVDYANQYNIKLSLWFGHAIAEWITENEDKMKEVGEWIEQGHEIGIHHHSVYKIRRGSGVQNQWDGYSYLSEQEALTTRTALIGNEKDIERWGYLGDLDDYMEVFHIFEDRFGVDVNLGIANEQSNKIASMPDELIYSAGSGFINNGEPGRWEPLDHEITKGVNEFISTAEVNGIKRKWLTHYPVTTTEYLEEAKETILSLDGDTVFVSVAHTFDDFEVFKDLMDFFHTIDPDSSKNLIVKELMEDNILEEKQIDLPCEDLEGVVCENVWGERTCPAGDWLIENGGYRCCSEPCPTPIK